MVTPGRRREGEQRGKGASCCWGLATSEQEGKQPHVRGVTEAWRLPFAPTAHPEILGVTLREAGQRGGMVFWSQGSVVPMGACGGWRVGSNWAGFCQVSAM